MTASSAPLGDPKALARLAGALEFICGADHEATLALRQAAAGGKSGDVKRAHVLFKTLPPGTQRAALAMIAESS